MPISIVCQSCGARYRVPEQYAGKSARCKKCDARIPVPSDPDEIRLRDDDAEPGDSVESMRSATMAAMEPAEPHALHQELAEPPAHRRPLVRAAPPPPPVDFSDKEDDESGASATGAFRPVRAAPSPWGGLLVLLYLATITGVGLFDQYSPGRVASDLRAAMPLAGLWTDIILQGVLFFLIVAPLALVGVYAASQIMRFSLVTSPYIKAAGAAAAPLVGYWLAQIIIAQFLTPQAVADATSSLVGIVNLAGVLGGLTAAVFLVRSAFGLNWPEAGAAFAMLALLSGIGIGLQYAISDSLSRTVTVAMNFKAAPSAAHKAAPPPPPTSVATGAPAPTPVAVDDPVADKLTHLTEQTDALLSAKSLASTPRESLSRSIATLQKQAKALGTDIQTRPQLSPAYTALLSRLNTAPQQLAAVPPVTPDKSLNNPIDTSALSPITVPDSAADSLADAVSVGPFKVRPPSSATLDLPAIASAMPATTQPDTLGLASLSWTTPQGGRLTVATSPQVDSAQQQPWVRTRSYMQAAPHLFTVDDTAVGPVNASLVLLNRMPATCVASTGVASTGGGSSGQFEQFIVLQNKTWATVTAQSSAAGGFSAVDAAARTLRFAPGETRVDPLTPALLAEQLGTTNGQAAEKLLRQMGKSAEPAVIAGLHSRNVETRKQAIAVLGDIGTQRAISALAELVRSNDTFCADAAKAALRKLDPKQMDPTNVALLELQGTDPQLKRQAMEKLAELKPDTARRPRVAAALEQVIIEAPTGTDSNIDAAGGALAVWQTPGTVRALMPLLNPSIDLDRRHAALAVFGKLKNDRAAYQVAKYLANNPNDDEPAKNSLVAMGSVAELDVIHDLENQNSSVRRDACEVLSQIGGQKSLNALGPVVRDTRDLGVSAEARNAMLIIQARVNAAKGGPTNVFDMGK